MDSLTIDEVRSTIAEIESVPTSLERFIPTRYPHTYAYDYLKTHAREFGLSLVPFVTLSRPDCAGFLYDNPDKEAICTLLADAYLREWHIKKEVRQS
jgi:hypothetical protein